MKYLLIATLWGQPQVVRTYDSLEECQSQLQTFLLTAIIAHYHCTPKEPSR